MPAHDQCSLHVSSHAAVCKTAPLLDCAQFLRSPFPENRHLTVSSFPAHRQEETRPSDGCSVFNGGVCFPKASVGLIQLED